MWSRKSSNGRRWFVGLLLLAVLLAIVIGSALMFAVSMSSIAHVEAQVDDATSLAGLVRLTLIGLTAILWRPVTLRLHAADRLCGRTARDWLALRWRVVAWMLAMELLIGRNLISQVIALFASTTA